MTYCWHLIGQLLENDKSLRESGVNNGAKIMLVGTRGFFRWDGPTIGGAPNRIASMRGRAPGRFASTRGGAASRFASTIGGAPSRFASTIGGTPSRFASTIGGAPSRFASTIGGAPSPIASTIGGAPSRFASTIGGNPSQIASTIRGAPSRFASTIGGAPSRFASTIGGVPSRFASTKKNIKVEKSRTERWKATNIVALAECNLKDIPDEVWPCAPFIRILDVSHNSIQHVPDRIDCLTGLRKLYLNGNALSDESISWQRLTSLKLLQVLFLSRNCLNTLPSTLGLLTSLQQLHVANNLLTALPIEIGYLTELEILKVNNNRISSIPSSIGNCTSLVEVDLSSNHLSELPDEFCSLHKLKALYLSNNAMKSLPNSFFMMCTQLSILDHHHTEITMDTLWQCDGWEDFEERRRAKRRKRNDFGVINSAESDEDADKN
ncbi:LRR repeats and ubiquitin-like domain-containing protein At2g30105 [Pistacia vera]|uniref:LRR repeats and ubiquitin-like domain-containing protein At2g30105 n=1 Tax=Pistacia vera TaxID=55513 RepID=UPI001262FDEB|nr:LRR repeats and ubiquitin-like domain-containing protein At2g30105 [Pistacia vera]